MSYKVVLSEPAADQIRQVRDKRIQGMLLEKIRDLADSPNKKGKALVGDLKAYRSVRAVGQRYRIIYQIEHETVRVIVVALGLRKQGDKRDIYKLAQKIVQIGLAD
jgi:mRNA interferase RelE/StbE